MFNIETCQTAAIRLFFMGLKNNFDIVTLKITERGITIFETNSDNNILMHCRLLSENFECYQVNDDFLIHINMKIFFKIVKTISNDADGLKIHNKTETSFDLSVINNEKNRRDNYTIKLIDRPNYKNEIISPMTLYFDYELSIPSTELKKLIKKMISIKSETITVKSNGEAISFICKNDNLQFETVFKETHTGEGIQINSSKPFETIGTFVSKDLSLSNKFVDLCRVCYIYAKKDYLVIKYPVASLGELKLCFSLIEIE